MRHATFLAVLLATACTTTDQHDGELVTMLHYVQTGRAQVDQYLARQATADLRHAIALARRTCVRLRSELGDDDQPTHLLGSGVLLADGRILTASHVVPESGATTIVTLADGSALRTRLLARARDNGDEVRDWAMLALDTQAPIELATTTVARPRRGQLVAILGYPQGVGIAAAGHVARDHASQPLALAPVATLARVVSRDPMLLAPVAGTLPVDGASGSAVFDADGRLLGVVVAAQPVSRTWLVQRADRVPAIAPPPKQR